MIEQKADWQIVCRTVLFDVDQKLVKIRMLKPLARLRIDVREVPGIRDAGLIFYDLQKTCRALI